MKFKERYGIGEARETLTLEAVNDWCQTVLQNQLEMFTKDNVFNVDKTRMFLEVAAKQDAHFQRWLLHKARSA